MNRERAAYDYFSGFGPMPEGRETARYVQSYDGKSFAEVSLSLDALYALIWPPMGGIRLAFSSRPYEGLEKVVPADPVAWIEGQLAERRAAYAAHMAAIYAGATAKAPVLGVAA